MLDIFNLYAYCPELWWDSEVSYWTVHRIVLEIAFKSNMKEWKDADQTS